MRRVHQGCLLALDDVGVVGSATLQSKLNVKTVSIPVQRANGARVLGYRLHRHGLQAVLLPRRQTTPHLYVRELLNLLATSATTSRSESSPHLRASVSAGEGTRCTSKLSSEFRRCCLGVAGGHGWQFASCLQSFHGLQDSTYGRHLRLLLVVHHLPCNYLAVEKLVITSIEVVPHLALEICMALLQHKAAILRLCLLMLHRLNTELERICICWHKAENKLIIARQSTFLLLCRSQSHLGELVANSSTRPYCSADFLEGDLSILDLKTLQELFYLLRGEEFRESCAGLLRRLYARHTKLLEQLFKVVVHRLVLLRNLFFHRDGEARRIKGSLIDPRNSAKYVVITVLSRHHTL
mmetsp:Transcript_101185/g.179674  ORF Transcript_101185/g.179674 Transcript_101185/m.179674 type:complete len:353 (+) Transcript_101185:1609-2667(+)